MKLTQAAVIEVFNQFGVTPIERSIDDLRDLMHPVIDSRSSDRRVVYRTVLSNGTGKQQKGIPDAELESDFI